MSIEVGVIVVLLHILDREVHRDDLGQREERALKDVVGALACTHIPPRPFSTPVMIFLLSSRKMDRPPISTASRRSFVLRIIFFMDFLLSTTPLR